MRISFSVVAFLLMEQFLATNGFSIVSAQSSQRLPTLLSLSAEVEDSAIEPTKKKSLTSKDIIANARAKAGLPAEEEAPKLFEDSLYNDMKQILLTLEKRVTNGPGSLSMLEVEECSAMGQRIVVEMKDFTGVLAAPVATPQNVPSPTEFTDVEVATSTEVVDTSNSEGPEYDGTGGMGLAKGTVNTYVIPGMDEMSPDEYQKALQKSISDRQTNRKEAGQYGNRATWDYLNSLTGESGVLKKKVSEE